jgi:DNA repair exonuclease SbcCD nuclease subunit
MQHHDKPGHAYAIVGNHDTAVRSLNTHSMHWLESLRINVIDKPSHNGFNGLPRKLSFLPYTEDVDVIKQFFADAIKKNDGAYAGQAGGTVCFMHAGIDGVPMKSGFVPGSAFNTDMIPEGVQHVFSGHYHPHMKVTDKATVVGSPLQLNWADKGDHRGFIVYDTVTGEQEFHEIDAPRFITLNMDGRGSCDYSFNDNLKNHFIRVENYNYTYQEKIRAGIMEAGARSVEFVVKYEQSDRLQPVSSDGLLISELVKEYEEQKNVSPECSKIGQELMK